MYVIMQTQPAGRVREEGLFSLADASLQAVATGKHFRRLRAPALQARSLLSDPQRGRRVQKDDLEACRVPRVPLHNCDGYSPPQKGRSSTGTKMWLPKPQVVPWMQGEKRCTKTEEMWKESKPMRASTILINLMKTGRLARDRKSVV